MSKNELTKETKGTMSQRFTNAVLAEINSNTSGAIQVTEHQKKLIQGYFVGVDRALEKAENDRTQKNKKNDLPYNWNNVDLPSLALDVMYFSKLGLDMSQDAQIYPIPYKNNKTNKYTINLMIGYAGKELIFTKYALDKPKSVTFELVKETDTFKPIKKDKNNAVESYEFVINQPFNRGKVLGGFAYIEFEEESKNKLVFMTIQEIMKRKPKYASEQFWGTWSEDMYLKTLKRAVFHQKYIAIDSNKIDDSFNYVRNKEIENVALESELEQAELLDDVITVDEIEETEIIEEIEPETEEQTETEILEDLGF